VLKDGEPRLLIYQTDVRAIQLAKAALYAGAKLLIDKRNAGPPRRIVLVGAFGSHIDTTYAMALGLIPDCDLANVRNGGNAAGTGARIALVNAGARAEIEAAARRIDKVETAIEPNFQAEFVGAMAFPHASEPFEHLAGVLKLPERKAGRGRRRR